MKLSFLMASGILLLVLSACAHPQQSNTRSPRESRGTTAGSPSGDALPEGIYVGRCCQGGSVREFLPCNTHDVWWLTGNLEKIAAHSEDWKRRGWPATDDSDYAFLRVRATPGPKGHYGYMGVFSRELEIDAVIEIHDYRTGDCGPEDDGA